MQQIYEIFLMGHPNCIFFNHYSLNIRKLFFKEKKVRKTRGGRRGRLGLLDDDTTRGAAGGRGGGIAVVQSTIRRFQSKVILTC